MQIICNDKTVKSNTIKDSEDFISGILSTQDKNREKLVSTMQSIEKAFDLMSDDKLELSTESESLKNKISSYDENCLKKSKTNLLRKIDYGKGAAKILAREKTNCLKNPKLNSKLVLPTLNISKYEL